MIEAKKFYEELTKNDIEFFTGVPDSLLKSFCAFIKDNVSDDKNITAANEGNALGLAAGYYLATGKPALVYMQNSGLGNVVNPLCSLTDKLVYSMPVLLIIGWRGEPGKKDEPQHKKQGLITTELLDTLGIKYDVLSEDNSEEEIKATVGKACDYIKENKEAYALVVKKNTFEGYKLKNNPIVNFEMKREDAIETLMLNIEENHAIVSTTGMASRELFELREKYNQNHERDFLTVGSMGHASQIALGIALNNSGKKIYCIDGDGAALMHMGGMAIIGTKHPKNFVHVLINNGAHDSVGGQETAGFKVDFIKIAEACGYEKAYSCDSKDVLKEYIEEIKDINGPVFLEIKVKKGARENLGRPTTTPIENKESFMNYLKN